MANAIDKAIRAQGGSVVKPHQVKAMILAALRAFKVQSQLGLVDEGVDFDTWRRANLHEVTGPAAPDSFRAVTQRDYAAVIEYFGHLALQRPPVRRAAVIAEDERGRALWALAFAQRDAAAALGGADGARRYADFLFEKIHKTSRALASAREIWAVVFTLKNRAAKKRARTPQNAPEGANAHLPRPGAFRPFPRLSRPF